MRIRLTQKLADRLDGVDLAKVVVGDVLELPDSQALCLILERWAVPEESGHRVPVNAAAEFTGSLRAPGHRRKRR